MPSASRARLTFFLLVGALLAWQAVRWGVTQHGVVSSWAARPAALTVPAATPRPVQQTFVMGADGFDGVWLETRTDGRAPRGDLIVDLLELTSAGPVRLERVSLPAADAVQGGRVHVPFREIRASRGHRYQLDIRHLRAEPGPSIELGATREDTLPDARLVADGVERWGDLVLHTTSRRATLPYWIGEILAPWPSWVRSPVTVVASVVLLNVMLIWACAVAAGVTGGQLAAVAADRTGPRDASANLRRIATAGVLLTVGGGIAATMRPTPALRTLDLIAALPEAGLQTTWPSLHAGISSQPVVFGTTRRSSIIAMPTSRIAWTIEVPRGAVFRTGASMRPDMWTRNSDGIQMAITVEHAHGRTLMAHLTLFPLGVADHRKLFPVDVPLHPWTGQRITLVLESTPERWGNAVNDVPVWVEPRIEWPRTPSAGEARVIRAGQ